MIELATLPVAERTEREIKRLRQDAHSHPGDPELQLRLALLLLVDGQPEEAAREFRTLLALNADSRIWAEAGTALVGAEHSRMGIDDRSHDCCSRPRRANDQRKALHVRDTSGNQRVHQRQSAQAYKHIWRIPLS